MSGSTAAWRFGVLSVDDRRHVRERLCRSLPAWLQDASDQNIAAEWYQVGQKLCRKGVAIHELVEAVETMNAINISVLDRNERVLATFRDFVRYYAVRGY